MEWIAIPASAAFLPGPTAATHLSPPFYLGLFERRKFGVKFGLLIAHYDGQKHRKYAEIVQFTFNARRANPLINIVFEIFRNPN